MPDLSQTRAAFDNAQMIYDAMHANARLTDEGMVWEGYTTQLAEELGISTPYYSHTFKCLREMESMIQLRRGGGSQTSQWLLKDRPTESDYKGRDSERGPARNIKERAFDQRINDLNTRVAFLERALLDIKEQLHGTGSGFKVGDRPEMPPMRFSGPPVEAGNGEESVDG